MKQMLVQRVLEESQVGTNCLKKYLENIKFSVMLVRGGAYTEQDLKELQEMSQLPGQSDQLAVADNKTFERERTTKPL